MFTKEDVTDDAHHASEDRIRPQTPQVGYCVDYLLFQTHPLQEILVIQVVLGKQPTHLLVVALDEADDPLPEVLRDVFGLILESSLQPASQLTFLRILPPLFSRTLSEEGFLRSVDLIEDVGGVLDGGVVVVYFLDVGIVEGVGSLVGCEEVVIGEGFAGVFREDFRETEGEMARDFKVFKIDHGSVLFIFYR